jgi:hypothetical protein
MAVDLAAHGLFQRASVVLDPDCLIKLEHSSTRDRLRKVMFDRVDHIIVWRVVPWVRVLLALLLIGVPGSLLLLVGDPVATAFAMIVILIALGVVSWYLYCRKTTIRIVRAGKIGDIRGIYRPRKVRRVVQAMVNNIRVVQMIPAAPAPPEPPVPPEPPAPPPAGEATAGDPAAGSTHW